MTIDENIWKIVTPVMTFVGGVFLERHKNKSTVLEKKITHQRIAAEVDNEDFGRIEITYNGGRSQNLHSVYVEIENNSSRTVTDFEINIGVAAGFYIYRTDAYLHQRDVTFKLANSENYNARRTFVLEHLEVEPKPDNYQDQLNYVTRTVCFHVPVLNKKGRVLAELLIDGPPILEDVYIGIFKDNVDVIDKADSEQEKKNRTAIINILASLIYLSSAYPIMRYSTSISNAVWLMVLASFVCYVIAWAVYFLYTFIRKMFF